MTVQIAQRLASKSNSELALYSGSCLASITNDPLFSEPGVVAQAAVTSVSHNEFQNALTEPLSETKKSKINVTRIALIKNMTLLGSLVEGIANNPNLKDEERAGVIASAGMQMKGTNTRQKQVFAVEQGDEEGTVYLVAEAGARSHLWEYTADVVNFKERIAVEPTTGASTIITGLTKFTRYAFFHKPIKYGVVNEWEGPLLFTVVK